MEGTVADLLRYKNQGVFSVGPDTTVDDAIGVMNSNNIGSVVVLDNERLVGVFTERDVLTRVVGQRATTETLVEQVMTKNPITVVRSTTIADAMRTMSVKRCRHLPVMFDGNVVNVVSAGDVMRHTIRYLESEVENLLSYVQNGGVTSHLF